jgi:Cof subfamily protein (haloacid dehalogenase superfamily)
LRAPRQSIGQSVRSGRWYSENVPPSVDQLDLCHVQAVFTDLDGTLLNEAGVISERTRTSLQRATAAGIDVVPVTARNPLFLQAPFEGLVTAPLGGASNGAVLVDLHEREAIQLHRFTESERIEVTATIERCYPQAEIGHQRLNVLAMSPELRERLSWTSDIVAEVVDGGWFKIVAYQEGADHGAMRDRLQAAIPQHSVLLCQAQRRTLEWIEVLVYETDKGTAIREIARRLGLDLMRCVGVGDEDNDGPMFDTVGIPIAMGNAVPELLERCAGVTADNNADGVALLLDEIVRQQASRQR